MSPVRVGIMLGRLTPPQYGRFQSFPADTWREEFGRARDAGLACIEWIYEVPHEDPNPVRTAEGIAEVLALSKQTGVGVWSICADYYMERLLVTPEGKIDEDVFSHLLFLIGQAKLLGATYIVLPFVDSSSLGGDAAKTTAAVEALSRAAPVAQAAGVELHLETDLPPGEFAALMARVDHPSVRVNYDIGNSASLGYDPNEELTAYGDRLGSVHVKDRARGSSTVPLTTGGADFKSCFAQFKRVGFKRWFILQAARGEEDAETALAAANRARVEAWATEAGIG